MKKFSRERAISKVNNVVFDSEIALEIDRRMFAVRELSVINGVADSLAVLEAVEYLKSLEDLQNILHPSQVFDVYLGDILMGTPKSVESLAVKTPDVYGNLNLILENDVRKIDLEVFSSGFEKLTSFALDDTSVSFLIETAFVPENERSSWITTFVLETFNASDKFVDPLS